MYLHVEPFKIIKNNISSRSHWKQEAEVAQHQIKSTESRCCGHNVASWWVARFAIVARHFQTIQKLFRIPVEFSKFKTSNNKDSNVGKTTTNHPPVITMMEDSPSFEDRSGASPPESPDIPFSLTKWSSGIALFTCQRLDSWIGNSNRRCWD